MPEAADDPLRRIALIAAAVLVPVVVALLVLVNVLGGNGGDDDGRSADPGPADIEGDAWSPWCREQARMIEQAGLVPTA